MATGLSSPLRLALTCDDAPTILGVPGLIAPDARRLDAVRMALKDRGVASCVAFVIGRVATDGVDALQRWLDAGYELGNHTFDHLAAGSVEPASFLDNVAACDRLLESLGGFADGRLRYFRFPFLDRGSNPESRRRIAAGLRDMNYVTVPGTVDFNDHLYEAPLARAAASGNAARISAVEERYLRAARRCLSHHAAWAGGGAAEPLIHIGLFHAGPISSRVLPRLLGNLSASRVEWCAVADALNHPVYRGFEADTNQTGLISYGFRPRSPAARVARKLARASYRWGIASQQRCGPLWPHLG